MIAEVLVVEVAWILDPVARNQVVVVLGKVAEVVDLAMERKIGCMQSWSTSFRLSTLPSS